jgi:hypothetical protein
MSWEHTLSVFRVEEFYFFLTGLLLSLFFGPKYGGSGFLRNVCKLLPNHTTSLPQDVAPHTGDV